ncbi:MAG: flagellar filament capping protein FliD [Phycisphaerae bacterium]|nr:flagellar filament capping protein FliD [Phycisphaerae bacterium]
MGSISTGVGLVSGINSAALIEQLLGLEAQGKTPIQKRVSTLTAQRTALLDVNSRLLNLKNSASKFRLSKIFRSSLATPSEPEFLTATADANTSPGSYQFFIKRLASTNQLRTKGFATSETSPLGLDSLRFEFGDVGVSRSVDLSSLNGGDGVSRGKIVITDKSGASGTIDLSLATTLDEVVSKINESDDIAVTASIDNERLVLTDTSAGSGQLKVVNGSGSTTATSLGILGSTSGTTITSTQIHRLGSGTSLSSLNDGNGVLIRDNAVDFKLEVQGSVNQVYNITLGRKDAPITSDTKLADLNNGLGVKINTTDAGDLKIITTTGKSIEVNLGKTFDSTGALDDDAVETVGQLIARINETLDDALEPADAGKVKIEIAADGKSFKLTDNLGGAQALRVLGLGPNGSTTAKNLGIYTETGSGNTIIGLTVPNKVDTPRASTLQDIIDRIAEQTEGNVVASINAAGTGLRLSAGTNTVTVQSGSIDGSSYGSSIGERTARDLGIWGISSDAADGTRILSGANTLLISTINGGKGLDQSNSLTVEDAAGNATSIGSLNSYQTLEQLVDALNSGAASGGVNVNFAVSSDNVSLTVTDTSNGSGTMTILGGAANALGLTGTPNASGVLKGNSLEAKYVDYSTNLSTLNFGKGIGTGTFRITDSKGENAVVDIDSSTITVYDLVQEINSRGLKVEARINDAGDGITLIDTNTDPPTVLMKVEDVNGGVAKTLGLKQTAKELGGSITSSFERVIDLDTADSLKAVVTKINAAGIPVTASLVNTGASGTPFYLSIASTVGGKAGKLLMNTGGVDLGLSTINEGRDAEIFFGNTDPAQGLLLRSTTNVFTDVIGGLDVTLLKPSDKTMTIDVTRDTSAIKTAVKEFVAAFNDAVGRIGDYDSYDVDTNKRGVLLGDSSLARARGILYTTIQGKAKNVSGQYQYMTQVGIRVGKSGKLEFDESKFDTAYAADPDSVEKLFVTFEQETVSAESVAQGVTVGTSKVLNTALGFGDLIDQAMAGLTSTIDGVFTKASQGFQTQIERANERLTAFDKRLENRRAILQRQFAAMEDSLAKLQTQQSSLTSILSTLG